MGYNNHSQSSSLCSWLIADSSVTLCTNYPSGQASSLGISVHRWVVYILSSAFPSRIMLSCHTKCRIIFVLCFWENHISVLTLVVLESKTIILKDPLTFMLTDTFKKKKKKKMSLKWICLLGLYFTLNKNNDIITMVSLKSSQYFVKNLF